MSLSFASFVYHAVIAFIFGAVLSTRRIGLQTWQYWALNVLLLLFAIPEH